ncbi:MAG: hypothetical protein PT958_03170 [Firmicutes bacterium]|nr:hypothetical protein [Bacillota bacterium]
MGFSLRPYRHPDFTKKQFMDAPDAVFVPTDRDFVAPENYHATAIFPEYFKIGGQWKLAPESRMDCVVVREPDGSLSVKEFRNLKKGDAVCVGRTEDASEGIYVHTTAFYDPKAGGEAFAFRQGRSRETAFSVDYDELYGLLEHEKHHGSIVWVLGPAVAFDSDSRKAFGQLIANGYCHALLAGNALATHDLEAGYKHTALGQDIYTQTSQYNGHYNHIDTINRVRRYGSIPAFLQAEGIHDGIIYQCVQNHVPFVLCGSIRDDGPLPEVYADVYAGQNAMRDCIRKATTVITMATTLHSIATGNMTPSFRVLPDGTIREVYFYCVDVAEFAVNKLADRGSLAAKGIVTNAQDFVVNVCKGLGLSIDENGAKSE